MTVDWKGVISGRNTDSGGSCDIESTRELLVSVSVVVGRGEGVSVASGVELEGTGATCIGSNLDVEEL